LTLPGMIEEPGSFSGSRSSPSPQRGPEPSRRMSFAILNSPVAAAARAPWTKTSASWAASASNLLDALRKGRPVAAASRAAKSSPNRGGALSPVPTAVPPWATG
jgi:hypothetical protein